MSARAILSNSRSNFLLATTSPARAAFLSLEFNHRAGPVEALGRHKLALVVQLAGLGLGHVLRQAGHLIAAQAVALAGRQMPQFKRPHAQSLNVLHGQAVLQKDVAQGRRQSLIGHQLHNRAPGRTLDHLQALKLAAIAGVVQRTLNGAQRFGPGLVLDHNAIGLGHTIARVGQHVGHAPVVGHQQHTGTQAVQAPRNQQPRVVPAHQRGHRVIGVAVGKEHPCGLVDKPVNRLGHGHAVAIDGNSVAHRVGLGAQHRHDLVVQRNAALDNQFFAGATRTVARPGKNLLQSLFVGMVVLGHAVLLFAPPGAASASRRKGAGSRSSHGKRNRKSNGNRTKPEAVARCACFRYLELVPPSSFTSGWNARQCGGVSNSASSPG